MRQCRMTRENRRGAGGNGRGADLLRRGTEATLVHKKRVLLDGLAGSSWRADEEPYTLIYEPLFTIPFLRRNEAAVRVIQKAHAPRGCG